jgi:hypothetical protein
MTGRASEEVSSRIRPSRYFEALYVGAPVRNLLYGGIGRVHSIYRRTLNIVDPAGGLVSIVDETLGRGPFSFVVRLPAGVSFDSLNISLSDSVVREAKSLVIGSGSLIVSTDQAQTYDPRFIPSAIRPTEAQVRKNLSVAREFVSRKGHMEGLGQLIRLVQGADAIKVGRLNVYSSFALPHVLDLLDGLSSQSIEQVKRCSVELIGLGPGATPSADDLLSGLMLSMLAGAKSFHRHMDFVREACSAISSSAKGKTTTLSLEYLRYASEGLGNEFVMDFLRNMIFGDASKVRRSALRLVAMGETSGTDIALGALLGILKYLDILHS